MRISTSTLHQRLGAQISDAQAALFDAQQRVLTGKRFERTSEDPGGSRIVLAVSGLKARVEGLSAGLRSGQETASLNETALQEISDILSKARQLGLRAGSGTTGAPERAAIAAELDDLMGRLVEAGNTTNADGEFIFAGHSSRTKPFVVQPNGALAFSGDNLPVSVESRPGEWTQVSMDGAGALITGLHDTLSSLKSAALTGQTTDSLKAVEAGTEQVLAARGQNGALIGLLQRQAQLNQARADDLGRQISDVQEIDLAEAMTQYQSANTAYSAALQFTARANDLSLMDFLR